MVKLLHTADLHLDGAFAFLGANGGQMHRRQLLATFDRIMEEASHGGYDLLSYADARGRCPTDEGESPIE